MPSELFRPEIDSPSPPTPAEPGRITKGFLAVVLALFAVLAVVVFPQVLRGKVPVAADVITAFPPWYVVSKPATPHAEVGDSMTLFYPWRVFEESALHRIELPLWNPYILGGTPFLAEAQSALFYPLHLLLWIQHPATFWTVKLLLNLMLAGAFTAIFAASIGISRPGAIAAGVAFSCCGFLTAWQAFSSLADAAIWLPFILWAIHRLCLRPSLPNAVISSIGFAMPILAGHPETAAHLTMMGWGFALWECGVRRKDGDTLSRLRWLVSAQLLALGLTAVQVLPTLEWLRYIVHSLDTRWPPHPAHQILAFLSRDVVSNPNSANLDIPESAAYIGAITLLLAPLAFLRRDRRESLYFVVVLVLATAVVQGWWPVQTFVERLPVIGGLRNGRLLLIIDFSLAVLAGYGVSALSETRIMPKEYSRYLWWTTGATAILLAGGIRILAHDTEGAVNWLHRPAATALFLGLGIILIALRGNNRLGSRRFVILVIGVLCIDMVSFRSGALPFASRSDIFPQVPLFQFLQSHADPSQFRVSSVGGTFPWNAEMVYRLAALDGYDLELTSTENLLQGLGEPMTGVNLNAEQIVKVNDRRLDLMNLRYLIATTDNNSYDFMASRPDWFKPVFQDGSVRVFENMRVLPRASFIPARPNSIEVIPDDAEQLKRLKDPSFDPEKCVILSAAVEDLAIADPRESGPSTTNTVSSISLGFNDSSYRVRNQQSGLLIISQILYPGWSALVDGKEAPLIRADYALPAIPLRAGNHEVKLVFRPVTFKIGAAISLFSFFWIAALMFKTLKPLTSVYNPIASRL